MFNKKVDWDYVKDSLNDIKISTDALNNWDKKDMSEFYFHETIIEISLDNIKNAMNL